MKEDTLVGRSDNTFVGKVVDNYPEEDENEAALTAQKGVYKPWQWKPGQSGNPGGRPKGQSMKEWTRARLAAMTDEERDAFLAGMPKEIIWRMSEGNPTEDKNISITVPRPILGGIVLNNEEISHEIAKETLETAQDSDTK